MGSAPFPHRACADGSASLHEVPQYLDNVVDVYWCGQAGDDFLADRGSIDHGDWVISYLIGAFEDNHECCASKPIDSSMNS